MATRIDRRGFFLAAGAAVIVSGVAGCGSKEAASQAARVVISVGWKYLTKIVKAVITGSGELIIEALVGETAHKIKALLSPEQKQDIGKGGKLILRTEDGKEHEVVFTHE